MMDPVHVSTYFSLSLSLSPYSWGWIASWAKAECLVRLSSLRLTAVDCRRTREDNVDRLNGAVGVNE